MESLRGGLGGASARVRVFNLYFEFGEVRRCCAAAGEERQGRDESLCPDGNGWERRKGGRMCHYEMVGSGNYVYLAIVFFFFEYGNKNVITFAM